MKVKLFSAAVVIDALRVNQDTSNNTGPRQMPQKNVAYLIRISLFANILVIFFRNIWITAWHAFFFFFYMKYQAIIIFSENWKKKKNPKKKIENMICNNFE